MAILGVILCAIVVLKDVRIHTHTSHPNALKLLSFNVRSFNYESQQVDTLIHILKQAQPDVICLQEFFNQGIPNQKMRAHQYIATQLGYKHYKFIGPPSYVQGTALFSKYPITQVDTLYLSTKEVHSGILAHLKTPEGEVGIVNLHLSSFKYSETFQHSEKEGYRWLAKKLYSNTRDVLKSHQVKANAVLNGLANYEHPLLIAGDLNSVPHSHVGSMFRNRYQDSFSARGSGIGWTYKFFPFWGVRIDYQFASNHWEICSHEVLKMGESDHYPLLVHYLRK